MANEPESVKKTALKIITLFLLSPNGIE